MATKGPPPPPPEHVLSEQVWLSLSIFLTGELIYHASLSVRSMKIRVRIITVFPAFVGSFM